MSNIIIASWFLYLGLMPSAALEVEDMVIRYNDKLTFIQTAGVSFTVLDLLRIWTDIEVRDVKSKSVYFAPYRAGFGIGAELQYKSRNWGTFFAGAYHECNHDIMSGFSVNPYNGADYGLTDLYAAWTGEFSPAKTIVLKPACSLGMLIEGGIGVKSNTTSDYFYSLLAMSGPNDNFYLCLGGEADLFSFIKLSAAFQAEYSTTHQMWSRLRIEPGIELYYRNIAVGMEWKKQIRLNSTFWAFSELRFYISFKGRSVLI